MTHPTDEQIHHLAVQNLGEQAAHTLTGLHRFARALLAEQARTQTHKAEDAPSDAELLDDAICLECQGGACTAQGNCEAMTNPSIKAEDARLFHAFGALTMLAHGDHAFPHMIGNPEPNNAWLCVRFNSFADAEELRQALKTWHESARPRIKPDNPKQERKA